MFKSKRGFSNIIALLIGIVLLVAVLLPVTVGTVNSTITSYSAQLNSTDKTILLLFQTLIGIAGLVMIAGAAMGFGKQ